MLNKAFKTLFFKSAKFHIFVLIKLYDMAKFIAENELNNEIEKLFDKAEKKLILISPFIKLHARLADALKAKQNNYKLEIIVVFGKNEKDRSKSLKAADFEFFKSFPNIEIRYNDRLHAKFYANERTQILTSMNLYDSSQNNNIEAGVKAEYNLLRSIGNKLTGSEAEFDVEAWNYFEKIINGSELLFKNTPQFDSGFLNKKFRETVTEIDKLSVDYSQKNDKITRQIETQSVGYCIRSRTEIPYNPQKPFSIAAYQIWAQYKDENYPENYCHKTGKRSNGKTSMSKPILYEA